MMARMQLCVTTVVTSETNDRGGQQTLAPMKQDGVKMAFSRQYDVK